MINHEHIKGILPIFASNAGLLVSYERHATLESKHAIDLHKNENQAHEAVTNDSDVRKQFPPPAD
jgi:hypothetical protein